jgi:hypothetical protein
MEGLLPRGHFNPVLFNIPDPIQLRNFRNPKISRVDQDKPLIAVYWQRVTKCGNYARKNRVIVLLK